MRTSRPVPGLSLIARAEWRDLRSRPMATAGTVLLVALAVALMVGIDLAAAAARRAFDADFARLTSGLTHEVTARAGGLVDADYLWLRQQFRAGALPGVVALTPRLGGSVDIAGVRHDLVGVDLLAGRGDRALTASLPIATALLAEPGSVLAGAPDTVVAGSSGRVLALTPAGERELRVAGVLPAAFAAQRLLLADIATAKELLAAGDALTEVELVLDCGDVEAAAADCERALRAALPPRLRLRSLAARHAIDTGTAEAFYFNLTALSLLAAVVAAFLVHQVVVLDVQRRATAFGRLGALGVTVCERTVVAAMQLGACVAAGAVLGIGLGRALADVLGLLVLEAADAFFYRVSGSDVGLDATSVLRALVVAVATALAAAWAPLRDLARQPIATLLRGERVARARRAGWWWPLPVALAGGVALRFAGVGAAMAALACLLLAAALAARVALAVRLPLPRPRALVGPVPLALAVRDLARNGRAAGLAAGALVVAVAAAFGMAWMIGSFRTALEDVLDQRLTLAAAARAPRLDAGVVAAVDALGVPRIFAAHDVVAIDDFDAGLRVVDAAAAEAVRLGLGPAAIASGRVALSEPLARRLALRAGDRWPLSPFGELVIGGVFREYGSVRGRVVMDLATARRAGPVPAWDELLADVAPDRLRALLAGAGVAGASVLSQAAVRDLALGVFARTFAVTGVALWLALLVAAGGLALAAATWMEERARELAVLRAVGCTRAQVAQLLCVQVVLLAAVAVLLALPAGAAVAWLLVAEVNPRAFGWSYPLQLDVAEVVPLLAALAAVLPLAALPALWRLYRRPPARLLDAVRGG